MAVLLNDNNNRVNYRLEVDASDGRVLVTEGTAFDVLIEGGQYRPETITLNGTAGDRKQFYKDAEPVEGSVAQEPVDTDPEPVAPIKPRTAPAVGTNPYVDRDEVGCGQKFVTSYNDEFYELEREYSDGRLILNVKDEDGNLASIYLTYRERIEMATRLLSVTEKDVLVSNGASSFVVDKNVSDEEVPRGIGAAVFMLHSHLEDLKHQERVDAYKAEHAMWEQRQVEKTVGMSEDEALHELVVRRFIERDPNSEDFLRGLEGGRGVKSSYPLSYSAYRREILADLRGDGLTAIQQLANVLDDEEKADASEEDALDAIALKDTKATFALPHNQSLSQVKRQWDVTFPRKRDAAKAACDKLGVTAVQYANIHGIKFPAA